MGKPQLYVTKDILSQLRECSKLEIKPTKRYPTGIPIFDHIFTSMGRSGLLPGNYLLVGDPGCGKSSMVLQMMGELKARGHICAYLCYEGKNQIKEVLLRLRMPAGKIPALMDDSDGVPSTSEAIIELMARIHAANKTGLPAVIGIDSSKNLNEDEGSTRGGRIAIKELKDAANEYNCIVLLIGHVTKETQGKPNKKLEGPNALLQLADVRIDFIDTTPKADKKSYYRSFTLDTSRKNRFGVPGEFEGFMLTEQGFSFPKVK